MAVGAARNTKQEANNRKMLFTWKLVENHFLTDFSAKLCLSNALRADGGETVPKPSFTTRVRHRCVFTSKKY